jgi:WhiB family redox-sensing transcriptional regulator
MTTPDWRDDAYCKDDPTPDRFHVTDRYSIAAAKAACAMCPVVSACLAEALADPTLTGVWGGTTDDERKKLRGRRPRNTGPAPCGTYNAAEQHRRRGEPLDEACTIAHRIRNREYAAASRARGKSA